jgi:hypothetical protein
LYQRFTQPVLHLQWGLVVLSPLGGYQGIVARALLNPDPIKTLLPTTDGSARALPGVHIFAFFGRAPSLNFAASKY